MLYTHIQYICVYIYIYVDIICIYINFYINKWKHTTSLDTEHEKYKLE